MASFATPADLATRMKKTFTPAQVDQAELLLAGATARIRALTDQWISQVVDDVFTTGAPVSRVLWLPQRPVAAVDSVKVDGVVVTDWVRRGGRLIRTDPWATVGEEVEVEVTYTHGYPAESDGLELARDACLALAAQGMSNPDGLKQESIDDYARTFGGTSSDDGLGALVKALVLRYGRRPRTGSIKPAA